MREPVSALFSEYIIDGVPSDSTPAMMLDECIPDKRRRQGMLHRGKFSPIVDETIDPAPCHAKYSAANIHTYLRKIRGIKGDKTGRPDYPQSYTRRRIAYSLIDSIWEKNAPALDNIEISASWEWCPEPIGNMASFYLSAEAAGQYIFDLGARLREYSFSGDSCGCMAHFKVFEDTGRPQAGRCPGSLVPDADSWLIYVPFDTCQYRLGDSLLSFVEGGCGETAPEVQDPDYFIDCFEVIKELADDGVLIAGTTVSEGGIMAAADSMCRDAGISIDISGIEASYSEKDIVRILFAETPGALIQIRDADYDYIDSQMLLQDIAYYPLGHPDKLRTGVSVVSGRNPEVSNILASLIRGQLSEGED